MTQTPVTVRVVSRSQGVDAVSSGAGTLTRRGKALRLVYETAEDAGTVRNTCAMPARFEGTVNEIATDEPDAIDAGNRVWPCCVAC